MPTAGYSGTPLMKKLGIKDTTRLKVVNAPADYHRLLEQDIKHQLCPPSETPDLVHVFVVSKSDLEKEMKSLKPLCSANPNIVIWVSWYKKTAGIATDVTEDVIRDYALANSLVDIKVCAVSEIWSGLKLMVPKNKR